MVYLLVTRSNSRIIEKFSSKSHNFLNFSINFFYFFLTLVVHPELKSRDVARTAMPYSHEDKYMNHVGNPTKSEVTDKKNLFWWYF